MIPRIRGITQLLDGTWALELEDGRTIGSYASASEALRHTSITAAPPTQTIFSEQLNQEIQVPLP